MFKITNPIDVKVDEKEVIIHLKQRGCCDGIDHTEIRLTWREAVALTRRLQEVLEKKPA